MTCNRGVGKQRPAGAVPRSDGRYLRVRARGAGAPRLSRALHGIDGRRQDSVERLVGGCDRSGARLQQCDADSGDARGASQTGAFRQDGRAGARVQEPRRRRSRDGSCWSGSRPATRRSSALHHRVGASFGASISRHVLPWRTGISPGQRAGHRPPHGRRTRAPQGGRPATLCRRDPNLRAGVAAGRSQRGSGRQPAACGSHQL